MFTVSCVQMLDFIFLLQDRFLDIKLSRIFHFFLEWLVNLKMESGYTKIMESSIIFFFLCYFLYIYCKITLVLKYLPPSSVSLVCLGCSCYIVWWLHSVSSHLFLLVQICEEKRKWLACLAFHGIQFWMN